MSSQDGYPGKALVGSGSERYQNYDALTKKTVCIIKFFVPYTLSSAHPMFDERTFVCI